MKLPKIIGRKSSRVKKTRVLTLAQKRSLIRVIKGAKPPEENVQEVGDEFEDIQPEVKAKPEVKKMEHDNKPILETSISLSKDGKYVIHKTIITDIKPIGYMRKVLGDE